MYVYACVNICTKMKAHSHVIHTSRRRALQRVVQRVDKVADVQHTHEYHVGTEEVHELIDGGSHTPVVFGIRGHQVP